MKFYYDVAIFKKKDSIQFNSACAVLLIVFLIFRPFKLWSSNVETTFNCFLGSSLLIATIIIQSAFLLTYDQFKVTPVLFDNNMTPYFAFR